jgi:hypothetical protein
MLVETVQVRSRFFLSLRRCRSLATYSNASDCDSVAPNKSLDASGASVFRIMTRPATLD